MRFKLDLSIEIMGKVRYKEMLAVDLPRPIIPNPICMIPAKRKTVKIAGSALAISPSNDATIAAITAILTAVIGAVGPDI